jgi:uncharacterized protein YjbI with pentapeptide repeats
MNPQVEAALIAGVVSLISLGGTVVVAVFGFRTTRSVTGSTLAEQHTRTLNERFATAAGQLGDDKSPAVRLAGVYAMAGLADDWKNNRQTCVDVLCAYLRLPHDPDPGEGAKPADKTAYRADREVRHTAIRVITAHLQADAAAPWHGLNLDFTGAVFDGGDFSGTVFHGSTVSFVDARFCGEVSFRGARFSSGEVSFIGAEFSGGTVDFGDTRFFVGAVVSFRGAEFSGGTVSFGAAGFHGQVSFVEAKFSGATVSFIGAEFRDSGEGVRQWPADFSAAVFSGGTVSFGLVEFAGGKVPFAEARFSGSEVNFGATFSGSEVNFGARFSGGTVDFSRAGFSGGQVSFVNARFSGGTVDFGRAWLSGGAEVPFGNRTFDSRAHGDWSVPPVFPWTDTPPPGVKLPRKEGQSQA